MINDEFLLPNLQLRDWFLAETTSHNLFLSLKGLQKMSYLVIISIPLAHFYANFLPLVYSIRWFDLNIRQVKNGKNFA